MTSLRLVYVLAFTSFHSVTALDFSQDEADHSWICSVQLTTNHEITTCSDLMGVVTSRHILCWAAVKDALQKCNHLKASQ